MNDNRKNDAFQALRGIAFLSVFISHAGIGATGLWGVTVFFILSGYLMTVSGLNKDVDSSVKSCIKLGIRKVKPLYKLHLIMMLFGGIVTMVGYAMSMGIPLKMYPKIAVILFAIPLIPNLLLIQSLFPLKTIFLGFNGVAWYLSTFMLISMLFPLLLKLIKKYKKRQTGYIAIVLTLIFGTAMSYLMHRLNGCLGADNDFWYWSIYISPFARVLDFFIGCNLGWLVKTKGEIELTNAKATCIELIFLCVLAGQYVFERIYKFTIDGSNFTWVLQPSVIATGGIMILLAFAWNSGFITRILTNKATVFIGNISGYGFLIHQPVYNTVLLLPMPENAILAKVITWAIYTLLTLAFSLITMKLIEGKSKKRA